MVLVLAVHSVQSVTAKACPALWLSKFLQRRSQLPLMASSSDLHLCFTFPCCGVLRECMQPAQQCADESFTLVADTLLYGRAHGPGQEARVATGRQVSPGELPRSAGGGVSRASADCSRTCHCESTLIRCCCWRFACRCFPRQDCVQQVYGTSRA